METRPGVGPEALADYAAFSMGQSEVLPSQVWDGEQNYTVSRVVLPSTFFFCRFGLARRSY
jgi:hypothetical protein